MGSEMTGRQAMSRFKDYACPDSRHLAFAPFFLDSRAAACLGPPYWDSVAHTVILVPRARSCRVLEQLGPPEADARYWANEWARHFKGERDVAHRYLLHGGDVEDTRPLGSLGVGYDVETMLDFLEVTSDQKTLRATRAPWLRQSPGRFRS